MSIPNNQPLIVFNQDNTIRTLNFEDQGDVESGESKTIKFCVYKHDGTPLSDRTYKVTCDNNGVKKMLRTDGWHARANSVLSFFSCLGVSPVRNNQTRALNQYLLVLHNQETKSPSQSSKAVGGFHQQENYDAENPLLEPLLSHHNHRRSTDEREAFIDPSFDLTHRDPVGAAADSVGDVVSFDVSVNRVFKQASQLKRGINLSSGEHNDLFEKVIKPIAIQEGLSADIESQKLIENQQQYEVIFNLTSKSSAHTETYKLLFDVNRQKNTEANRSTWQVQATKAYVKLPSGVFNQVDLKDVAKTLGVQKVQGHEKALPAASPSISKMPFSGRVNEFKTNVCNLSQVPIIRGCAVAGDKLNGTDTDSINENYRLRAAQLGINLTVLEPKSESMGKVQNSNQYRISYKATWMMTDEKSNEKCSYDITGRFLYGLDGEKGTNNNVVWAPEELEFEK